MNTQEKDLLKAFRAMDARSQAYILRVAKSQAADCPLQRTLSLRLVPTNLIERETVDLVEVEAFHHPRHASAVFRVIVGGAP